MAHTTTTTTTSYPTRKYRLRNSPPSRLRQTSKKSLISSSPLSRGVLLPLPPNLRRLPSRLALFPPPNMTPLDSIQVGSKRKRVVSTNENAYAQGRSLRKLKRRRGYKEQESEMDVDGPEESLWIPTDDDNEEDIGSRDHYNINLAPMHQLIRLRKEELVRLYVIVVSSTTETDHLTKHDLVEGIIGARHGDTQQVSSPQAGPPSSPSSNGVGDDESELDLVKPVKKLKNRSVARSFSLNCLPIKKSIRLGQPLKATRRWVSNAASNPGSLSRSHSSSTTQSRRSSPSANSTLLVTRLRTRTVSFHFRGNESQQKNGNKRNIKQQPSSDETDEEPQALNPSPRRLRARPGSSEAVEKRRVTPMRKAKGQASSLKRSDEAEDGVDEDERHGMAETEQDEEEEEQEEEEDDELDELVPSLIPSPRKTRSRPHRSSPVPYALRRTRTAPDLSTARVDRGRRLRRTRTQISGTASDGDDENTDDEDHGAESDGEDVMEEVTEEEDDMEVEVEPKRLRNGKIVGEEEEGPQSDPVSEADQDGDVENKDREGEPDDAASIDLEADSASTSETSDISVEEDGEEAIEEEGEVDDDVDDDLQDATAKALVRKRRDHLVKLCESRGIDTEGTKPQLVEALLQWRDQQSIYTTSPSSGATARPPSTSRPKRRSHNQTPVLERSDRIERSDPDTPHPRSNPPVQCSQDDGVLLDLEGLGLEDSVIPPSKLMKLEKIGSGGFKDVFVGKLGGKKVAIAEFRGQLTEMDIKELKLLARFDHPNVVKFLGVSIPENPKETPMIVSELCSNGDLFDYVRNVAPPHLNKVLSLMLDIARGLKYLHDHKPSVIHRDCKSSNILITMRATAKIADFGLAKVKQSTRSMVRSLVGTVNWQAPELWHAHPKYNFKVDVFSCAMVFWEILQWHGKEKKFPWEGMNEHAIYEAVGTKQQRPSVSGLAKLWCPEIVELMESMWAQDHKDRPDMTYVVETLEALKEAHPPPKSKNR